MKRAWKELGKDILFLQDDYICSGYLALPLEALPKNIKLAWERSGRDLGLLAFLLDAKEVRPAPESIALLFGSENRRRLSYTGLSYSAFTNDKDKFQIFKDDEGTQFLFNLNCFSAHVGEIELIEESGMILGYIPTLNVFITRIEDNDFAEV